MELNIESTNRVESLPAYSDKKLSSEQIDTFYYDVVEYLLDNNLYLLANQLLTKVKQ